MILGNPIEGTFTCTNQSGALFDPDVVQVSFIKDAARTIEDTLTYGGTDARDAWLTRTALGTYAFSYKSDLVGVWSVFPRWKQETSEPGVYLEVTPETSTRVVVSATPHQFTDRPAA
jgi:hypothetical protein